MIHLQDVSVEYPNGVWALHDVDLSVFKSDFAFVVGATGCGKSTLLRLIYRELLPTTGRIIVQGDDVTSLKPSQVPHFRRKLGIVFQDYKLLPQKNVWENVAYALRVIGAHPRDIRRRIGDVLNLVGLSHRCDSFPHEMSGGEQQRAAIARALINNPTILVADEPTGNLDPDITWHVMKLFRAINARGTAVVIATHDYDIVKRMDARIIKILGGKVQRETAE